MNLKTLFALVLAVSIINCGGYQVPLKVKERV